MGLRLLIVDDHEVVREGLLATLGERYEILAAFPTAAETLDWIEPGKVDVALVDFRLPDLAGDILCERLLEVAPTVSVVILTTYSSPEVSRRVARAGVTAYVRKSAGLPALYEVLDGLAASDPAAGDPTRPAYPIQPTEDDPTRLTPQQESVLELAARGLTNREIGTRLYISESTVRFHLQKLKAKFDAKSKTNLIARAIRGGAISPAPDDGDLP